MAWQLWRIARLLLIYWLTSFPRQIFLSYHSTITVDFMASADFTVAECTRPGLAGKKKQTKKNQYHFKWMLNHTVKLSEDTYKRRAAYHHCGWFVQTVRQAVWTGSSPCCLSLLWWNHSLTLSRFTLRNRRNTQLWLNCGRNKQKSSPLYRLFISSLRLASTWNLPIYRFNTAQYLNFFFAVFLLFWSSGLHTAL